MAPVAGLGYPAAAQPVPIQPEIPFTLLAGDCRRAIRGGNLGIEFPLFGEPKVVEKIVEQVKVVEVAKDSGLKDSDGDGIVDDKDNCPNTPAGTRVDGDGCPLGDVVALDGVNTTSAAKQAKPEPRKALR